MNDDTNFKVKPPYMPKNPSRFLICETYFNTFGNERAGFRRNVLDGTGAIGS